MKFHFALVAVVCALWGADSYPASYYPYFAPNVDAISFGANDDSQSAMSYSRYYQPYYSRGLGGGMAAFMFGQPQVRPANTNQGYYLPDKRRQTTPETHYLPPQQNEVYYPQYPDEKVVPAPTTEVNELPEVTDKAESITTTVKAIVVPELSEEVEEATEKPRRKVSKKKQVKRPVDEAEEDEEYPRMPSGAYFPMFFGWGGRSGSGGPGGATAIANAYSTGRGGVASSHATAYGAPRPEEQTRS